MFEDIQKHRQAVRENIEKSLQIGYTESEDYRWNEKDKNYDLPHGYKMVGK